MAGQDLYIIQMAATGDVKIGRSDAVESRLRQLQTGCPKKLRVILHAPNLGYQEKELHQLLRRHKTRAKGEWFAESCLGGLPVHIYEMMTESMLEDCDWWKDQPVRTSATATPPR